MFPFSLVILALLAKSAVWVMRRASELAYGPRSRGRYSHSRGPWIASLLPAVMCAWQLTGRRGEFWAVRLLSARPEGSVPVRVQLTPPRVPLTDPPEDRLVEIASLVDPRWAGP
jgi:hypothetical protein